VNDGSTRSEEASATETALIEAERRMEKDEANKDLYTLLYLIVGNPREP